MGILVMAVSVAIGAAVWWMGRRIAANQRTITENQRRIAELEARVTDLSNAEHVLDRAQQRAGDGRGRHLKLLGLIPALWMLDQVVRRPAVTAAAVAATLMVSAVTIDTNRLPHVFDKLPGVAEPAAGDPPTSELEARQGSISATDTTATIPPPPTSIPAPELPSTTEPPANPPRGTATTTTTTAPVPGSTTTTTLEVIVDLPPLDPGEVPPSCLIETDAPGLLKLCVAG